MWNFITAALRWTVLVVGAVVLLAAFGFIGVYCWQRGLADNVAKALAREKEIVPPLSIRLYGPPVVLRGSHVYFHARVEGNGGTPTWSLAPPSAGALTILPGGNTAEFRSLDEGAFSLTVAVAGEAKTVSSDHLEFENMDMVRPGTEQAQVAAASVPAVQATTVPDAPPPTIAELLQASLEHVMSDDRAAEARMIAGSIRAVIGRIDGGYFSPDVDPMVEVETQAKRALGERFESWGSVLQELRAIMQALRQQGDVTTAASTIPALTEMANTLQHAR